MVRLGEDISGRLVIIRAQFFVYGRNLDKCACRCWQLMVQEPVAPQVFTIAPPASGLQARTIISRFVDHLRYYKREQINARSGVHTPRTALTAWGGQNGSQLMPLWRRIGI